MADTTYTLNVDTINFHPKLNNAIFNTKRLKDQLKAYMDGEVVANGGEDATYKADTDAYMEALDNALVAYEAQATEQSVIVITQEEANKIWKEKTDLDAEIAILEADPDIYDLEAVPAYKKMKLQQVYLDDAYSQLTAQGYTPPVVPVAEFSATPLTIDAGLSTAFTDDSLNQPTSWEWTFNGGSPATSVEQNPVVIYDVAGIYNVTLVATNIVGSDSMTKAAYITVEDLEPTPTDPNCPPCNC